MAYLMKVGNSYNIPAQEYICDKESDFTKIEHEKSIPSGSTVYIIDTGVTMIKYDDNWESYKGGGSPQPGAEPPRASEQGAIF